MRFRRRRPSTCCCSTRAIRAPSPFSSKRSCAHVAELPMITEAQQRRARRNAGRGVYAKIYIGRRLRAGRNRTPARERPALNALLDDGRGRDSPSRRRGRRRLPAAPAALPGMTNYTVRHRTTYRVRVRRRVLAPARASRAARRRRASARSPSTVTVAPKPVTRFERTDFFGNTTSWFIIDEPHATLEIIADSRVAVGAAPGPRARGESRPGRPCAQAFDPPVAPDAFEVLQYTFDTLLTAGDRQRRRLRPHEFSARAAAAGMRPRAELAHPRRLRLRQRCHRHAYDGAGSVRVAGRRLPGPRARRHRVRARDGARRAVRQRLSVDASAARDANG